MQTCISRKTHMYWNLEIHVLYLICYQNKQVLTFVCLFVCCVYLEIQLNVPLQFMVAIHIQFMMCLILYRENEQISLVLTLIYTLSINMKDLLKKPFEGRLQV
jgi:hypothetical protein